MRQLRKISSQINLEQTQKGYFIRKDASAHNSVILQWLLCELTVAWNWFIITLLFPLIWQPLQLQTCVQEHFSR